MATAQSVTEEKLITGEELFRMPDLGRCELVEGKIVMMSPTGFKHSVIELNIALALKTHVEKQKMEQGRSPRAGRRSSLAGRSLERGDAQVGRIFPGRGAAGVGRG